MFTDDARCLGYALESALLATAACYNDKKTKDGNEKKETMSECEGRVY
jgi:hypothetical protein